MARTLDTPKVETITQQALIRFRFEVPQKRNDGDTAMEIDTSKIYVHFEVDSYDDDGNIVSGAFAVGKVQDWPNPFKTDVAAVYNKLVGFAESLGLIAGSGTNDPLG